MSVAVDREARPSFVCVRTRSSLVGGLLVRESLCVVALCWFAAVLLLLGPRLFTQDSWLTLVGGREIVEHGLPARDRLAVLTSGREWVDQQWLAHVLYYAAARATGLAGAYGLQAVALLLAMGLAMVAARRRGGSMRAVALVVPAMLLVAPSGWDLRAQALAYVPFVLVLWLLVEHRRHVRPAVLAVLPVLVLWANLHGSVLLGASLVALYGVSMLVRPALRGSRITAAVLVLAAPVSVLASPYGLDLVGYYRRVVADPPFAGLVLEWQRATFVPSTALFWLGGAVALALVARRPKAFTPFEAGVLAVTFAAGVFAVRNLVWFALAAAVLVPHAIDAEVPALARRRSVRSDAATVSIAVALVTGLAAWSLVHFDSRFRALWPARGAERVSLAAAADGRVFASERLADWLLWERPSLRGRIAYDARVELLSRREAERIVELESGVPGSDSVLSGYSVVALTPHDRAAVTMLRRRGSFRLVHEDDRSFVLVRNPPHPLPAVQASTS